MSLLCHQLLVSRGLLTFYSLHQLFSATNIAAVVIVVTDSQYVFTQSNRSNASCVFHSAIIALLTLNTRCNAPVLGFLNCQNYGCQFEGCQRLTYQKVFFYFLFVVPMRVSRLPQAGATVVVHSISFTKARRFGGFN